MGADVELSSGPRVQLVLKLMDGETPLMKSSAKGRSTRKSSPKRRECDRTSLVKFAEAEWVM